MKLILFSIQNETASRQSSEIISSSNKLPKATLLSVSSIAVSEGEHITQGSYLGNVGHSGNSTEPHLHFQLMDSAIIESANGLPLVFDTYEKYNGNTWEIVQNQFPAAGERIHSLKSDRN